MSMESLPSGRRAFTWQTAIASGVAMSGGWILGAVIFGQIGYEGWGWTTVEAVFIGLGSFALNWYLRVWARKPRSS
jgi:hypothetical protein